MKNLFLMSLLCFVLGSPLHADESKLCSSINYCQVEKKTWGRKGWNSDYKKEAIFSSFCENERPNLQLEPELGIELWIFKGSKTSENWLESQPHVTANLYTYKLTHVVASGSAPLSQTSIVFSHRLKPNGKTLVEVSCYRK